MDYTSSFQKVSFKASSFNKEQQRISLSHGIWYCDGIVSPSECEQLISLSKPFLQNVGYEYVSSYRRCERSVLSCSEFANVLNERIRIFLERADLDGIKPSGFGTEGTWALLPVCVNNVVRISKYEKGSFFAKHRDNGFVFSDDIRSIFTIVIYLSDKHEGGKTRLFLENDSEITVDPKIGRLLCFPHDVPHEGTTVDSEEPKWVLRTDIMFRRLEPVGNLHSLRSDSRYIEANKYYQNSIELQKEGQPAKSTECFLKALEIHSALCSWRDQKRSILAKEMTEIFPKDIWIRIMMLLPLGFVMKELCCVNSFFNTLIRMSSAFWVEQFRKRWNVVDPRIVSKMSVGKKNQNPKGLILAFFKEMGYENITAYMAFKSRFLADKNFNVTCIDLTGNLGYTKSTGIFSSRCGYASGHLWCVGQGMFNCVCGKELETDEYKWYSDSLYHIEPSYFGTNDKIDTNEKEYNCIATIVPTYSQWFGPHLALEPSCSDLEGFNAVVAALVARYCISKKHGDFGQYYGEELKESQGHVPVLLVVPPFVVKHAESFYKSAHMIIPLLPHVLVKSIAELLALYFNVPNALVIVPSDCFVCFCAVYEYKQVEETVYTERFEKTLFSYPMLDPVGEKSNAIDLLIQRLSKMDEFFAKFQKLKDSSKIAKVLVGGTLISEKIIRFIEEKIGNPIVRSGLEDEYVVGYAMENFCSVPSSKLEFRPIEIKWV